MSKIMCFISEDMADFEITLVLHRLKRPANETSSPSGTPLTQFPVSQACGICRT